MNQRYYIARSSVFDTRPYPVATIAKAVRVAGGKNVRSARYQGWSNQPSVVTFSADGHSLGSIKNTVERVLGLERWGVIIHPVW